MLAFIVIALSTSANTGALLAWHMPPGHSPEDLAYASRASPGLWVDCLLEMHVKETLPSAGIWSRATGCRGSSIRTDYVVLVCHFRLMANKIYFWLRILAS